MPREKSAGAIIFRRSSVVPSSGTKEDRKEPSFVRDKVGTSEGQIGDNIYYLLLHYHSGHWEFPKGHIEKGESEEETVKREVFEETGINDLKIVPGFKQYSKYFFRQYKENISEEDRKKGKTPWVFKLVTFFIAETKIKEIKISHEHIGFLWLPINEAIKKTTFKNSKELLKKANEFIISREGLPR